MIDYSNKILFYYLWYKLVILVVLCPDLFFYLPHRRTVQYTAWPFGGVTKQAHSIGTEGEIVLCPDLGNSVRSLLGK